MRGAVIAVALTLVAASACGAERYEQREGGDVLPAEVLYFDVEAVVSSGTISDRPVDVGAFLGWQANGSTTGVAPESKPGTGYVVVSRGTGCWGPETAELVREGDDLYARFLGGEYNPDVECGDPAGAVVQFAVNAELLLGARTVDGKPPLPPGGPGELTAFVRLGSRLAGEPRAVELGTAAASGVSVLLEVAGSDNLDQAKVALAKAPPPGRRGYAFVLSGCAEDSALLIVRNDKVGAELSGGANTNCVTANYFLATFTIDEQGITELAVPGTGPIE